ncbi:MAG: TraB/GumN family protein [Chloroflexi bacterium]|nr:TraB/GumN family protein [Ardenticatenaceae bacterium]MBL1130092.1 TraB/GumN family protein [Chloroflexota bacterium]NOG36178.1 TraB/GumN family protein [Chloroflexota bacterium]GIK54871.1 MAG: conjugal transfer protein TraB [Chloroflexota bacterium]
MTEPTTESYSSDVAVVEVDGEWHGSHAAASGRTFIIVGTAHISQESTDLVRQVIEREQPDVVCVELDEQRYQTLANQRKWESLDLRQVIRQKQMMTLIINLMLSSYQKRLGQKLGVAPGTELLEATKVAQEMGIPVELVDRDVRITLRRAWNGMSFWEKSKLLSAGLTGMMEGQEISEEQLAELRQTDVLTELMQELGRFMPKLKTVLIDERDTYITQKILAVEGQKVVAVVGAGHMQGIRQSLAANQRQDLAPLETIPPPSKTGTIIGWGLPLLMVLMLGYIGVTQGAAAFGQNLAYWILAGMILSAVGAIAAYGHPVTVLVAFFTAPYATLNPLIGVGYIAALAQVYVRPPTVKQLQTVGDDVTQPKLWWQNRLLRVMLVFIFTTIGNLIGNFLGASEIIRNLF